MNQDFTPSFKKTISLRPYGPSMLTPMVGLWLSFTWIIILLMALVEGSIWGIVSQYFVPDSHRWLWMILGPLFFIGLFLIIWIVDVSFITSEKPLKQRRAKRDKKGDARQPTDFMAAPRWWFGLVIRLAIVLISLLITAPFLTLTIRSNDITVAYKQMAQEQRKEQEGGLLSNVNDELNSLIDRRTQALSERAKLIQLRAAATAVDQPRIDWLNEQSLYWQGEYDKELTGAEGRRKGEGPNARQAKAKLEEMQKELSPLLAKREKATRELNKQIAVITKRLATIADREDQLNQRKTESRTTYENLGDEAFAERYNLDIPSDTLGTRQRLLKQIQEKERREAERFIGQAQALPTGSTEPAKSDLLATWARDLRAGFGPWLDGLGYHFKTVEGLSQAILGMLFLSLVALKIFEPSAVRLYFNEEIQHEWRVYQKGGYDGIPGFEPSTGKHALTHFKFADAYLSYQADPDRFQQKHSERQLISQTLVEHEIKHRHQQDKWENRKALREEELKHEKQRLAELMDKERQQHELDIEKHKQELALDLGQRKRELDLQAEQLLAKAQAETSLRKLDLDEHKAALQAKYKDETNAYKQELSLANKEREQALELSLQSKQQLLDAELQQKNDEIAATNKQVQAALTAKDAEVAEARHLADIAVERTKTEVEHLQQERREHMAQVRQEFQLKKQALEAEHDQQVAVKQAQLDEANELAKIAVDRARAEAVASQEEWRVRKEKIDQEWQKRIDKEHQELQQRQQQLKLELGQRKRELDLQFEQQQAKTKDDISLQKIDLDQRKQALHAKYQQKIEAHEHEQILATQEREETLKLALAAQQKIMDATVKEKNDQIASAQKLADTALSAKESEVAKAQHLADITVERSRAEAEHLQQEWRERMERMRMEFQINKQTLEAKQEEQLAVKDAQVDQARKLADIAVENAKAGAAQSQEEWQARIDQMHKEFKLKRETLEADHEEQVAIKETQIRQANRLADLAVKRAQAEAERSQTEWEARKDQLNAESQEHMEQLRQEFLIKKQSLEAAHNKQLAINEAQITKAHQESQLAVEHAQAKAERSRKEWELQQEQTNKKWQDRMEKTRHEFRLKKQSLEAAHKKQLVINEARITEAQQLTKGAIDRVQAEATQAKEAWETQKKQMNAEWQIKEKTLEEDHNHLEVMHAQSQEEKAIELEEKKYKLERSQADFNRQKDAEKHSMKMNHCRKESEHYQMLEDKAKGELATLKERQRQLDKQLAGRRDELIEAKSKAKQAQADHEETQHRIKTGQKELKSILSTPDKYPETAREEVYELLEEARQDEARTQAKAETKNSAQELLTKKVEELDEDNRTLKGDIEKKEEKISEFRQKIEEADEELRKLS